MALGSGREAGSEQNTMAFLGVGLMCEHARRGLSNIYLFFQNKDSYRGHDFILEKWQSRLDLRKYSFSQVTTN